MASFHVYVFCGQIHSGDFCGRTSSCKTSGSQVRCTSMQSRSSRIGAWTMVWPGPVFPRKSTNTTSKSNRRVLLPLPLPNRAFQSSPTPSHPRFWSNQPCFFLGGEGTPYDWPMLPIAQGLSRARTKCSCGEVASCAPLSWASWPRWTAAEPRRNGAQAELKRSSSGAQAELWTPSVSIGKHWGFHGGTPHSWMVYKAKSHWNGGLMMVNDG